MDEIFFLNTKNFYSFKINNFITKEEYEELDNDFPDYHTLKEQNALKDRQDKKFIFPIACERYSKFLQKSKVFESFHNKITSKEFFFQIYKSLFFKILSSKKTNIRDTIKLLRFSKFTYKDLNIIEKLFFKKVKINYEISYLLNGAHMEPHTDSRSKLGSIMLYFPQKKLSSDEDIKKEKEIGTQFWDSELANYENDNFLNFKENFYNKSAKSIKTTFEKYTAYGFLKNDKSWHSVDHININQDYIRRSINISLSYD